MSTISSWVMSICGVSILSVLIDLFLPDGETNKHIKNVFSFAILLVMIAPLPNIIKNTSNLNNLFDGFEYSIQSDFIYSVNKSKIDALNEQIEDELTSAGINNVQVDISANIFENNLQIDAVFVDLSQMIINDNLKNINIIDKITNIVQKIIYIEKEKVIINE